MCSLCYFTTFSEFDCVTRTGDIIMLKPYLIAVCAMFFIAMCMFTHFVQISDRVQKCCHCGQKVGERSWALPVDGISIMQSHPRTKTGERWKTIILKRGKVCQTCFIFMISVIRRCRSDVSQ